jgi:hypothetical protein
LTDRALAGDDLPVNVLDRVPQSLDALASIVREHGEIPCPRNQRVAILGDQPTRPQSLREGQSAVR